MGLRITGANGAKVTLIGDNGGISEVDEINLDSGGRKFVCDIPYTDPSGKKIMMCHDETKGDVSVRGQTDLEQQL